MAKNKSTTSATTTPSSKLDTSRLMTHGQLAEGGLFEPSSFKGYVLPGSMYCPHRILSKENEERIQEKGLSPEDNIGYKLCIRLTFRVLEVYEPSDGSFDRETFESYIALGGKSLQHLFATNDGVNPAGDDEATMKLFAKGYMGDDSKPTVIGLKGPEGDEKNLSIYDGRWVACYESTPESRRKLEPKSGYVQFMTASAPAIEAVDPSMVVPIPDKKGTNVTKLFNVDAIGPDGLPLGSTFFDGLSGVWDLKRIPLEDLKDKEGKPMVQKVRMLTSYDGRVDADGNPIGKQAQASQAPASAPASSASPSPSASSNGGGDIDSRLKSLILEKLPAGSSSQIQLLIQQVITNPGSFAAGEMAPAMFAADKLLRSCPPSMTPEIATMLAGMGGLPLTFNPETQIVSRVA